MIEETVWLSFCIFSVMWHEIQLGLLQITGLFKASCLIYATIKKDNIINNKINKLHIIVIVFTLTLLSFSFLITILINSLNTKTLLYTNTRVN